MQPFPVFIGMVHRVVRAIRKQIRPRDLRCRQGCIFWQVGVDEPADHWVVVPALQVVEAGFDVLVVAPIPQGVDACEGAVVIRDLAAGVYRDGGFAPGVVAVGRDLDHIDLCAPSDGDGLVELCHITLLVGQIIVGKAVAVLPVDHGQGLALGVVEEIKLVVDIVLLPLLPYDLAVLREVVVCVNSLGFSRRCYSIALRYDLNLLQDLGKTFAFAEFYLQRILERVKYFLFRRIIRIPNEKILESLRAQEFLCVIARQGILIFPKQERDLFLRFDQPFELCSALD